MPCFNACCDTGQPGREEQRQNSGGRMKFGAAGRIQLLLAVAVGAVMTYLQDAWNLPAHWARSVCMSKSMILGVTMAIATGASSVASAQCGCGSVQSYQRYSCQPATVQQFQVTPNSQAVTASPSPAVVGGNAPAIAQSQAGVAQSYRRYSYQPQAAYQSFQPQSYYQPQTYYQPQSSRAYSSSSHRKSPWEYAKGERGRNTP